ncbi:hypothetical protein ABGB18_47710 [Nonomuraea sp. B12E4]|uniref:hypothetical protein n=1 Tax=Nonomuraea sp. B12E4 TaxID=3153564 RepID=UPI00325D47FA
MLIAGVIVAGQTDPVQWMALAVAIATLGVLGKPADRPLINRAVVPSTVEKLTSDIVVRSLTVLGIAGINQAIAKNPKDAIRFVAPITRDGPGWRADIDLPYGVTVADVTGKRDRMASALRRPLFAHRSNHRAAISQRGVCEPDEPGRVSSGPPRNPDRFMVPLVSLPARPPELRVVCLRTVQVALGARLHAYVESGRIRLVTGFFTHAIERDGAQVRVIRHPDMHLALTQFYALVLCPRVVHSAYGERLDADFTKQLITTGVDMFLTYYRASHASSKADEPSPLFLVQELWKQRGQGRGRVQFGLMAFWEPRPETFNMFPG